MNKNCTRKVLKSALKQNFAPPPAQRREQFLNSISYPKAQPGEVLMSQIGFIRKRVWLLFFICVCFAFFYTELSNVPKNIISIISAILPIISLGTITEIYKSTAHNMCEMELACKHNLSKITLMRLGILGTVSFVMLLLFVAIAYKSDFGTLRNTVYIAVPYLLTSYLSLLIICNLRTKETIYVCGAVSFAVSVFIMIANNNYKFIYNSNFTFIWVITFAMLIGLLTYNFIRFVKLQEEIQWNLL